MADPSVAREVDVPLRRLGPWLDGFEARHGPWHLERAEDPAGWRVVAADGSAALVNEPSWLAQAEARWATEAPHPGHPSPGDAHPGDPRPGDPRPETSASGDLPSLALLRPAFGVLLIRRAGYAIGLFHGTQLIERKVGSRHIHGRTAAGGWSQQRYARRRANQADEIVDAAAGAANRILGRGRDAGQPVPTFLATGGDRPLLADVTGLLDPVVAALPVAVHLGIGTPDAKVLAGIPDRVLSVRIEISEP